MFYDTLSAIAEPNRRKIIQLLAQRELLRQAKLPGISNPLLRRFRNISRS